MIDVAIIETLKKKYEYLRESLDEKSRRLWGASEAIALGHGGIAAVSKATRMAESTIRLGKKELQQKKNDAMEQEPRRVRRAGGGRKSLMEQDAQLMNALDALVEPTTRGDPMSPLRWTCKSTRKLARELKMMGHNVSHTRVAELLRGQGYSLQSNQKVIEGNNHPDRNAQFIFINNKTKLFKKNGQPVISVDTKKVRV